MQFGRECNSRACQTWTALSCQYLLQHTTSPVSGPLVCLSSCWITSLALTESSSEQLDFEVDAVLQAQAPLYVRGLPNPPPEVPAPSVTPSVAAPTLGTTAAGPSLTSPAAMAEVCFLAPSFLM